MSSLLLLNQRRKQGHETQNQSGIRELDVFCNSCWARQSYDHSAHESVASLEDVDTGALAYEVISKVNKYFSKLNLKMMEKSSRGETGALANNP